MKIRKRDLLERIQSQNRRIEALEDQVLKLTYPLGWEMKHKARAVARSMEKYTFNGGIADWVDSDM